MSTVTPISLAEFATWFKRCRPPSGWPSKIAVANSGGPDSTCLLFLLARLLAKSPTDSFPNALISITVNHALQPSSDSMASSAAEIAEGLGVPHLTASIPWSSPPFPPKPTRPFEGVARDARYRVLFDSMKQADAEAIAMGHHVDDQVETAVIRSVRGSTVLGLAGMRRCRRWGMGEDENEITWRGYEGMDRWIVRPLLDASKERILRTCDTHNLAYVTDPTNFQPEITLRNAVRHALDSRTVDTGQSAQPCTWPSTEALSTPDLKRIFDPSRGRTALRQTVQALSFRLEGIEAQATQFLTTHLLPSPPSTVLLQKTSLTHLIDPLVRQITILRLLRYVSPHPWGSIAAEAHRRSSSLNRIANELWGSGEGRRFSAGAGVMWTPVWVREDGRIKVGSGEKAGGTRGWFASRVPPYVKRARGRSGGASLTVDVTDTLVGRIADDQIEKNGKPEILWDNRFLLVFDLSEIPKSAIGGRRVLIVPDNKRWFAPRVVSAVWDGKEETGEREEWEVKEGIKVRFIRVLNGV